MRELRALNKYFYKYRWRFGLGILFVALSNYFRVLLPQTVREAIDMVVSQLGLYRSADGFGLQAKISENVGHQLLILSITILCLVCLMGLFMYFMRQTIIVMSRLIEYDLRKEIYEHYQKLDQAYFRRNATGDLMSRLTEDVSKVRMYLGPGVLYGINLFFLVIMVISAMIRVNPKLSLYTLAPLPLLSLLIYVVSSMIHKRSYAIQVQLAQLNSVAQETYSGIKLIKAYVQEKANRKHFEEESESFKEKSLDLARVNAFFHPVMILLIGLSSLLVIYIGGLEVINGNASPGNIAEFIIYLNMLTWPVTSIGWIASIVQQASASQSRINQLLETEPDIINTGTIKPKIKGHIVLNDLSFTYKDTGIDALKNINVEIKPGEKVAILGRTASGKSTIADLLLRLYDPTEGSIAVDNVPLKDIHLDHLRDQVAYVPQDVFLFSDTIKNNINFSRPDSDQEVTEQFAKHASVHDDIIGLPNGYDTIVGERGVTLSGGQKQRVSIARAMIKDPAIVILDDCLSAVDANTESAILDYLSDDLAEKTAIIITHRIPAHFRFDQIIVLDKGEVAESGTHDELIQHNGKYAQMLRIQQMQGIAADS